MLENKETITEEKDKETDTETADIDVSSDISEEAGDIKVSSDEGTADSDKGPKADEAREKVVNIASPLKDEGIRGDGTARWYVVHTYSGHEKKVKDSIDEMVKTRNMHDLIHEVAIPMKDTLVVKDGRKYVRPRKMFPGYVIVKMVVTNESWYLVRNTQGVTGFVGQGSDPIPLTKEETVRMGVESSDVDINVRVGDTIRVIRGPFETMMGEITEINADKQKLKATISAFGRATPVELDFTQVEKII